MIKVICDKTLYGIGFGHEQGRWIVVKDAEGRERLVEVESDEAQFAVWNAPVVQAKTRCVIQDLTKGDEVKAEVIVGWAESWCSVRDVFNKEKGRKIALGRALENGGFGREERRRIWGAYWKRG